MNEIYYEKEGDEFVLIFQPDLYDDQFRGALYRGKEVAIGFTYDPDSDRSIQFTTHRHGDPEAIEKWARDIRFQIHRARFLGNMLGAWAQPHIISTDRWDVEDLNRIIDTTGYLQVVVEKLGIKLI